MSSVSDQPVEKVVLRSRQARPADVDLRAYCGGLDKLDLRVGGAGYGPVPHTMGAASTSGNFFSAYLRYCWMWSAIASAEAAGSRSAIAS